MIVSYKAKLKNIERGEARINVQTELEGVFKPLLAPVFAAMLRSMKDTDKRAFYKAMANFAEDDFHDAQEFLFGEREND